jgi:hypothetical protein
MRPGHARDNCRHIEIHLPALGDFSGHWWIERALALLPPGAGPGAGYPTGVHCPRCPHRQLPKQKPGEAVQSSHQWIFGWGLIGVLAVIVAVGCEQPLMGWGTGSCG